MGRPVGWEGRGRWAIGRPVGQEGRGATGHGETCTVRMEPTEFADGWNTWSEWGKEGGGVWA